MAGPGEGVGPIVARIRHDEREAVVQNARRLERAPHGEAPVLDLEARTKELPWSRRLRLFFILGAATLCWAVPGLLVYWLAR